MAKAGAGARQAIAQIGWLLRLAAQLGDSGRYAELAALFTEDGIFTRPSDPDTPIRGRADILQSLLARPGQTGRRHLVADPFVQIHDTHTASAHSLSILVVSCGNGSGLVSTGGFRDRLVRPCGQWMFAQRAGYTLCGPTPYPTTPYPPPLPRP